ncbi:T9SS type A sorting domain-containing protein, partial [bacterium]|nr:T9SS type A sorting domain-containing protein [bacterium]
PPVTNLIISSPNILTNGFDYITYNTTLSLTATDDLSGVKDTYYKFINQSWQTYAGGNIDFSFLSYGPHTIYYYSIDNDNNTEQTKAMDIFTDNIAPQSGINIGEPKFLNNTIYTIAHNTPITLNANDNDGCGVNFIKYTLNSNTSSWTIYAGSFDFSSYIDGQYIINYFSGDLLDNNENIHSLTVNVVSSLNATIDFDPDTLNLQSEGKPVTVYIELPNEYDVNDINISTLLLNDQVYALASPTEIGDHNSNGIPDLMVKFDRKSVEDILSVGDNVEIKISGYIGNIPFIGYDHIKTINPPYESDNTVVMGNKINPNENSPVQIYSKLSKPTKVTIKVYTLNGKFVKKIMDEYKGAGTFEAFWNGTNAKDQIVASGIYLINIHTDYFNETKKVLIVK